MWERRCVTVQELGARDASCETPEPSSMSSDAYPKLRAQRRVLLQEPLVGLGMGHGVALVTAAEAQAGLLRLENARGRGALELALQSASDVASNLLLQRETMRERLQEPRQPAEADD